MAYLAEKELLRQLPLPPAGRPDLRASVRRPQRYRFGRRHLQFADENLPTGKLPTYHAGDVAMANTGSADTNGSQFFFVYDNSQLQANYTLWGHVIEGLDIVKKVAAGGDDGAFEGSRPAAATRRSGSTFKKVTPGRSPSPACKVRGSDHHRRRRARPRPPATTWCRRPRRSLIPAQHTVACSSPGDGKSPDRLGAGRTLSWSRQNVRR